MVKKALITGIFGQDGSYLCELLIQKGYEVHGLIHSHLSTNSQIIKQLLYKKDIKPIIHILDLQEYASVKAIMLKIKPDEIFHLAALHLSSQDTSNNIIFNEKIVFDHNVIATSNILCICHKYLKGVKIVLAGSCLMYDNSKTEIQDESTPFDSRSLYGLAKITENSLARLYRMNGLHVSTAILYNHESSRRSDEFVTKKIIKNMVAIKFGLVKKFTLGNIEIKKDWGFAKDYVYGMYLMTQQAMPDDYILSSGELHTIQEFVEICALLLKIKNCLDYIEVNPSILNRKITGILFGNCSKAQNILGWTKRVDFTNLIHLMLQDEIYKHESTKKI
jgi:GDPmannose 4,6-dehydratase